MAPFRLLHRGCQRFTEPVSPLFCIIQTPFGTAGFSLLWHGGRATEPNLAWYRLSRKNDHPDCRKESFEGANLVIILINNAKGLFLFRSQKTESVRILKYNKPLKHFPDGYGFSLLAKFIKFTEHRIKSGNQAAEQVCKMCCSEYAQYI